MTEIERIKEEKAKMEAAIRIAVCAAANEFQRATSLTPSSISVEMVQFNRVGVKATEYFVGNVTARIEL